MSESEPLRPLSGAQREAMKDATDSYAASMTADAARYLLARGIHQEAATYFKLGVVADPLPGHERFRGFLAIPYLDRAGQPLSMRFRCIAEHEHRAYGHGKYMSMTGEPARVYNVAAIHQADDVIHITEGEFDAQVLTLAAGMPAVAIPGASGWQSHHRRMLAGFSRVWVWGDPDDAGADFITRVCRSLRTAKGVRLRTGDVTDTYLTGGATALHALISKEATA